jgi:hypothetical protein
MKRSLARVQPSDEETDASLAGTTSSNPSTPTKSRSSAHTVPALATSAVPLAAAVALEGNGPSGRTLAGSVLAAVPQEGRQLQQPTRRALALGGFENSTSLSASTTTAAGLLRAGAGAALPPLPPHASASTSAAAPNGTAVMTGAPWAGLGYLPAGTTAHALRSPTTSYETAASQARASVAFAQQQRTMSRDVGSNHYASSAPVAASQRRSNGSGNGNGSGTGTGAMPTGSGRGVWFDPTSARDADADAGERALKLADAEFCVRLLQPAPIVPRFLDAPPYYFDAHAPARRMIEVQRKNVCMLVCQRKHRVGERKREYMCVSQSERLQAIASMFTDRSSSPHTRNDPRVEFRV